MTMKKIALITGASRGIGAATAKRLAQAGYDICINYHKNRAAAELLAEALSAFSTKVIAVQADVSQEQAVENLFNTVDKQLGTLTALVNNAGIVMPQTTIEGITAERVNRLLQTNVISYFLCCREAVKRMAIKHGGNGGAIVNVSSAASRLGSAGEYIDYAASKGAVDTLTKGLSLEVANQGIRVNAVRPGIIDTEIHADGGDPDRIKRIGPSMPMQRAGEAEEVANAIAWLLSDEASYTTGSFTEVAGGR